MNPTPPRPNYRNQGLSQRQGAPAYAQVITQKGLKPLITPQVKALKAEYAQTAAIQLKLEFILHTIAADFKLNRKQTIDALLKL